MVSASSATEPLTATTSTCSTAVRPRPSRLIFTARTPCADPSSAESTESAASWLCGRNSPVTKPRNPPGWSCSWSSWVWVMSGALGGAVQVDEVGVGEVVPGHPGAAVLGVVHRVGDELGDVLVLQPVEDLRSLPPGLDEPGHPEL